MYLLTCVHEGRLDCACMCAIESVWIQRTTCESQFSFSKTHGVWWGVSNSDSQHSCVSLQLWNFSSRGFHEPQAFTGQYSNTCNKNKLKKKGGGAELFPSTGSQAVRNSGSRDECKLCACYWCRGWRIEKSYVIRIKVFFHRVGCVDS